MPAGRPTKRTPELVDKILDLTSEGDKPLSLTAACGECGISRRTWADWEASDPDLLERREIARAKGQATLERRALDADITGPSANVISRRLGAIDPENHGEVQVNINGGQMTLAGLMREDAKRI